jgi:hypothetical protein
VPLASWSTASHSALNVQHAMQVHRVHMMLSSSTWQAHFDNSKRKIKCPPGWIWVVCDDQVELPLMSLESEVRVFLWSSVTCALKYVIISTLQVYVQSLIRVREAVFDFFNPNNQAPCYMRKLPSGEKVMGNIKLRIRVTIPGACSVLCLLA